MFQIINLPPAYKGQIKLNIPLGTTASPLSNALVAVEEAV